MSTYREGNFTVQTEVLDASEADYYYDVVTNLPVYANGSSANTGYVPPPEKRDLRRSWGRYAREKRGVEVEGRSVEEKRRSERRNEKALKARKQRWRRAVPERQGYGSMRMPGF